MTRMVILVVLVMIHGETVIPTIQNLDSVNFSNLTLELNWEDLTADFANLDDKGDCIYEGHLVRDAFSTVLVTGCEDDFVNVQIQSKTVGDRLFSLDNGTVVYVEFSQGEFDNDYEENVEFGSRFKAAGYTNRKFKRDTGIEYIYDEPEENPEFDIEFPIVSQENGRIKRDIEYEYDYYEEPIENPDLEEKFPSLDGNEIEDLILPKKLIFNINVYLDTNWYTKLGKRDSLRKAKQVLTHATKLFSHESMEIRIDLQHGNRIYESTAQHLNPNKKGYERMGSHLRSPYTIDGDQTVAHLQLTMDGKRRTGYLGKAKIGAICTDKRPRALVKYSKTELRTAMTVAHELGHLLGMYHDFQSPEGGYRDKCGAGRKTGGTVMNYGDKRLEWSRCSNQDFIEYYKRVVVAVGLNDFCLKDPTATTVCKCNGKTDLAGGECKTQMEGGYWCYVDKTSTCPDKTKLFQDSVSIQACSIKSKDSCHFRCKSGKCISEKQRCDGISRDCPDGDDEAGCKFDDYFD